MNIPQLMPQEACLKCLGCCRFREQDSVFSPCLLDEEIQGLMDRDIPPALLSLDKKIRPVPLAPGEGFACAFLDTGNNKCKVYEFRPFECRLYPFLINLRGKKVYLTVDINCPYVQENLKAKEFKEYTERLAAFLNAPAQIKTLKENPQIIQAYTEVIELLELNL